MKEELYKTYAKELLKEFPMFNGVSYLAPFLVLRDYKLITIHKMCNLIYGERINVSVGYKAAHRLMDTGFINKRNIKHHISLSKKGLEVIKFIEKILKAEESKIKEKV